MKPKLQELRKAAGWKSARAYAEHMGMNVSTYTDYEQGRISMPIERAWAIADDLDVTLDELMGRTPPAERKQEDKRREAAEYIAMKLLELTEGAKDDEH